MNVRVFCCAALAAILLAGCGVTQKADVQDQQLEVHTSQADELEAENTGQLPEAEETDQPETDETIVCLDWEIDSSTGRITLSLSDGTSAEYTLPESIQGLNEKELLLYTDIISCAVSGSRMMIFFTTLQGEGRVAASWDGGITWKEEEVPDVEFASGSRLGFIPGGGAWLAVQGNVGAGMVFNTLYLQVLDGVWTKSDAFDSMEPRKIDYVTFLSETVGFISVGAGWNGRYPYLYATTDGGVTWTSCTIRSDRQESYVRIDSIAFANKTFEMHCSSKIDGEADDREIFVSDDGVIWSVLENVSPALPAGMIPADDTLLSMVVPLEIAMAKCGEFVFSSPSELSNDQLFMAFTALTDVSAYAPYVNSHGTGYEFTPDFISQQLASYFQDISFSFADMHFTYSIPDTTLYWNEDMAADGQRNGRVVSKALVDNIVMFTVDYYDASGEQGKCYLTKTYAVELYDGGYYYLSSRIDWEAERLQEEKDGSWQLDADKLTDEDLVRMVITPEIILVNNGFTFRDSCEFSEKELYLLFLGLTEEETLCACYNEADQMFHFTSETVTSSLERFFQHVSFDITEDDEYDKAEHAIVTPLASGFGGNREMKVLSRKTAGNTIQFEVGFYNDNEMQGDPKQIKTYTVEFYDGGYYFISAVG